MDRAHNRNVAIACLVFRAGQRIRLGLDMWASELPLETDANLDSVVNSVSATHNDARPLLTAGRAMQLTPPWHPALLDRLTRLLASITSHVVGPWQDPTQRVALAGQWKVADPLATARADLDQWLDDLSHAWVASGRAICLDCLPPPVPAAEVTFFVASSSEGADAAEQFRAALAAKKPAWKLMLWNDPSVFTPGKSTLDDLERIIGACDFGIYVLTPDDKLTIRNRNVVTPRGNVIFELGMGVGLHRSERSLIVHDEVHRISDLDGITTLRYKAAAVPRSWIGRLFGNATPAPQLPIAGECERVADEIITAVGRETKATERLWRGQ
ncbi:MAG: TIR domain-containing protein [Chthoniobacteraceae bacterium]